MDSVTDNLFYKFSNIVAHKYQGHKYLSLPKEDASIENIADTGEVCDDDFDFEEHTLTVHGDEVIGVLNLQTFPACIVCKAEVSKPGYMYTCGTQLNVARCAILNS